MLMCVYVCVCLCSCLWVCVSLGVCVCEYVCQRERDRGGEPESSGKQSCEIKRTRNNGWGIKETDTGLSVTILGPVLVRLCIKS